MIIAVNYANSKYRNAQRLNSKQAKRFGADKVIEYTESTLPQEFISAHKEHFANSRGNGYWIWKPYIVFDALQQAKDGDYIIYTDSGSAFVKPIKYLIDAMEKESTEIMCFSLKSFEYQYTKRDAFVLMDCDTPAFTNSKQILASYFIIKKSPFTVEMIKEYLRYAEDIRIVSDQKNVMCLPNYEGFIENRHDQTVWSLLCKKNGIKPFRDPSEFGLDETKYSLDVVQRSRYPQIIESHRKSCIKNRYYLSYYSSGWRKIFNPYCYLWKLESILDKILCT